MSQALPDLRRLLEERFPDSVPLTHRTGQGAATGIEALDGILPTGGLPRSRLITWTPGGGATAILRCACHAAVARRERAAWVDGAGVVAGASWAAGPPLIRPPDPRSALEAAEVLVRSGGFVVVVLTGGDPSEAELVRLSRAAREGGAALVVVGKRSCSAAALRLSSRIRPGDVLWREGPFGPAEVESVRARVRARALGLDARAAILLPVASHEYRLSLDPRLADRRGAPDRAA